MSSQRARILITIRREMILHGELPPCKAIEEIELSRKLAPLGQPFATLEKLHQEGLLEQLDAGGYTPRLFTAQDIADAVIGARGALESLAAELAARRTTNPSQLDRARGINAELAQAAASFGAEQSPTAEQMASFGELNLAFHQASIALAKAHAAALAE